MNYASGSSSTSPTPVELALREGKQVLSLVTQITTQAERGGMAEVDKGLRSITEAMPTLQALVSGQLSTTAAGGGIIYDGAGQGVQPRGGQVGAAASPAYAPVTDMQRRRAQQVLSELQMLETTLRRYQRKAQQQNQMESNVQQLLGGYSADAAHSNYSELDHLKKEEEGLRYARRRMQQMQHESAAVLSALQNQGQRLGGMGDKLGDMMESLGVSNTTVLQIVRRNQMDAWLVYAGIIFLLFLMWYIW